MKSKSSTLKKLFSLPLIPTLVIIVAATALLVYVFHTNTKGVLEYIAYLFSAYSLVLACTGYARLVQRDSCWAKPFTLSTIPTMIIIIVGAALEIYVFTVQNFGPIAYVAYLLSAYALVLAIVGYVRLARVMAASRREVSITGRRGSIPIKSKFLSGLMGTFLSPFVEAVFTYFSYTMVKTAKGVQRGSISTILLAILSIIGILLISVIGPVLFLVGVSTIYIFSQFTNGIILCAVGLVLMVLTSQIMLHILEQQKEELAADIRSFRRS